MKIIDTTFERLPRERLVIGFEGENLRATVRIDCASVFAEYPNATPTLIVKPLFADAYPVVVDRNGTDVDWLITSEILSFSGDGEIQLVFYKDEVICKSVITKIRVCHSLTVTGEMPDVVATWIENANRKLAEVDAQIVELEGMVDTATDAATRAEQSASTASAEATSAAGSAATATEKATEATQAAGTATAKAAEAALSATQASNSAVSAADSESGAIQKAAEAAQSAQTANTKAGQATEAAQTATGKAEEASASATAAQASATDAASSATAASASETAAKASETAAGTSATQAAQSAQSANTAAQTATQKAAEASQSASNAATSATNAATSAETASTKAGEAAQSAQDAEETAEQLADSLEQIEQNTQDIAEHEQYAEATYAKKTDLYKKADIIHSTASGTIASFPDGAEMPVDEVTVQIEPVQDLHGYDHPWPAGGGVNLFDIDNITYISGAYGLTTNIDGDVVRISGTYTGSGSSSYRIIYHNQPIIQDAKFAVFRLDTSSARTWLRYASTSDNAIVVELNDLTPNTDVDVRFRFVMYTGTTVPTAYSPFFNICPISGWTEAKVTRTGKNLFNPDGTFAYIDCFDSTGGPLKRCGYVLNYPAGTYKFSAIKLEGISRYLYLNVVNADGTMTDWHTDFKYFVAGDTINGLQVELTEGKHFVLYDAQAIAEGSTNERFKQYNIQIELGSTQTDYEPYAGQTYEVTFPTEAGTVYGGELTVNADGSGSLVVDRAMITVMPDNVISVNVEFNNIRCNTNIEGMKLLPSYRDGYVDKLIYKKSWSDVANTPFAFGCNDPSNRQFVVNKSVGTTLEEIRTIVGTDGLHFVTYLATPITYTLTASQIRTLLGTNNVWSDAGDISVKYNADTKLYIDGKIAELVAQIVNS